MKQHIIQITGFLFTSFFILSLAVAVTINFYPLYAFDINYLNIPNDTGLSKAEILVNYQILLDYLNSPVAAELNMPSFSSSAKGLFHFAEVKKLVMLDYLILTVSAIGTSCFLWYIKSENKYRQISSYFRWGMFFPLIIVLALLISFDTLFVLFHQVFFNNDAWLFNPATDPIILALPAEFFMHSFFLAFGLVELVLILGYFTTKKRSGPSLPPEKIA